MIGKISQTQSMDFSFVSSLARPAAGQPFFFFLKKKPVYRHLNSGVSSQSDHLTYLLVQCMYMYMYSTSPDPASVVAPRPPPPRIFLIVPVPESRPPLKTSI